MYNDVVRVFEEKYKDWREGDHEASKLLFKVVASGNS